VLWNARITALLAVSALFGLLGTAHAQQRCESIPNGIETLEVTSRLALVSQETGEQARVAETKGSLERYVGDNSVKLKFGKDEIPIESVISWYDQKTDDEGEQANVNLKLDWNSLVQLTQLTYEHPIASLSLIHPHSPRSSTLDARKIEAQTQITALPDSGGMAEIEVGRRPNTKRCMAKAFISGKPVDNCNVMKDLHQEYMLNLFDPVPRKERLMLYIHVSPKVQYKAAKSCVVQ
jgi:hypothetical protein